MLSNEEILVEWNGATLKKLKGLGERSATGMDSERGVYVVAVTKGSKADRNGLKANDVILKVDSQETNNTKDVVAKYDAARWKGTIEILLFSQQNQKVIQIKNE
jgi:S1-C subfamily serine protease